MCIHVNVYMHGLGEGDLCLWFVFLVYNSKFRAWTGILVKGSKRFKTFGGLGYRLGGPPPTQ